MAIRSEVTAFYRVSTSGMNEEEVLGLHENIPRCKAQQVLDEANLGRVKLSPEGWFDNIIVATGGRMVQGKDGPTNEGGDYAWAERAHNAAAKLENK